jgi:hypothetical protein
MSDEMFPKRFEKHLPENFKENSESKSNDELLKEILKASHAQADTEKDMLADAKLSALKEDLKALNGGYRDLLACENSKIKYCLFLLKSRGAG